MHGERCFHTDKSPSVSDVIYHYITDTWIDQFANSKPMADTGSHVTQIHLTHTVYYMPTFDSLSIIKIILLTLLDLFLCFVNYTFFSPKW